MTHSPSPRMSSADWKSAAHPALRSTSRSRHVDVDVEVEAAMVVVCAFTIVAATSTPSFSGESTMTNERSAANRSNHAMRAHGDPKHGVGRDATRTRGIQSVDNEASSWIHFIIFRMTEYCIN